jgi:hypothetical protein
MKGNPNRFQVASKGMKGKRTGGANCDFSGKGPFKTTGQGSGFENKSVPSPGLSGKK